MKLQIFNGGKSVRLASHLLSISEGVVYSNIDVESAVLAPVKKNSTDKLSIGQYAYYFEAKDEWLSSSMVRDYVEYQEKVYFTEVNSIPKVYDGTNTNNLGVKPPTNALILATAGAGNLTGVYTYAYTYYNNASGVESSISFLASVTASANSILLSDILISSDTQVTHKRIYRVGGNLTTFTLVATIDKAVTSYTDNISDTAIDGRLLESVDYLQAKYGAKYLTEAYAMLFYALDDKVYYTPIGKPWAWPEEFFIDFPLPITGIGVVPNGLLVFTRLKTYVVTGNSPATLSKYTLSSTQGCKLHKSIQELDGTLLWVSNDGICASGGGIPKVISREKLGSLAIEPVVAVVLDNVYYLHHTTGSIVYDVRFGAVYKDLDLGNTYLVVGNDKIYGYFGTAYHELFASSDAEAFDYLSPVFLDGSYTKRKKYKTFYLRSEGQITIAIYIDGKLINTWNLTTTDTHDLDIQQKHREGYSVQFRISGTGTVLELSYQPYGNERN